MNTIEIIFWTFIFIISYTYIGYGLLLFIAIKIKQLFSQKNKSQQPASEPDVTMFVAAYNEIDFVDKKVANGFSLDYPAEKMQYLWVSDGSDDGTSERLSTYEKLEVRHENKRGGKIGAINRGMKFVKSPIVIFSDANTMLNKDAVKEIVRQFDDPEVGCVSGEKRIEDHVKDAAAGAGEGLYWRYESILKKMDSQLYSAVGAAGELFAVRTELFEEVEQDTLLDDFIISLRIAMKGYKIRYTPMAYAVESASQNVKEELKRKIRISAGGIQSIIRLRVLLNVFAFRTLSFQYISHRVLRWTLAPLSLPIIFILNALLIITADQSVLLKEFYEMIFIGQLFFYVLAFFGWYFEKNQIKIKAFFIPYYFFIMNLSVFLGFFRIIKKQQSVLWERAQRG